MSHGLLAETFRAEAQRLSEVYDCTYYAQDEPSGHYQELAPARGSGLALGLRTSGPGGDLFLTTSGHHLGNLEVDESDVEELLALMRAAAAGSATTRNLTAFGRTAALQVRFGSTSWAFPFPVLLRLFSSPRDRSYDPWPARANA
jgi:hypothetical protein